MPTFAVEFWYTSRNVANGTVEAASKREAARVVRERPWDVDIWSTEQERIGPSHVRQVERES